MKSKILSVLTALSMLLSLLGTAQPAYAEPTGTTITIDGLVADWDGIPPVIMDVGPVGTNISYVYLTNDADNIYIRVDGTQIGLAVPFHIGFDTDFNPNTGYNTDTDPGNIFTTEHWLGIDRVIDMNLGPNPILSSWAAGSPPEPIIPSTGLIAASQATPPNFIYEICLPISLMPNAGPWNIALWVQGPQPPTAIDEAPAPGFVTYPFPPPPAPLLDVVAIPSYHYQIDGDTFTSQPVQGTKNWHTKINNQTGVTVTGIELAISSPLTISPWPETWTTPEYTWVFGELASPGSTGAGFGSTIPVSYTPAFDVTRSIVPPVLSESGQQTLTIVATPRVAMSELSVNIDVKEDLLIDPQIISAIGGNVYLNPDGRSAYICVPSPVTDQEYTFTVVIGVQLKVGAGPVEHMPSVKVNKVTDLGSGIEPGNTTVTITTVDPEVSAIWSTTSSQDWHWGQLLFETVEMQGRSEPGSPVDSWTVMVYMAADNNLESFALADIDELEIAGSSDKVNIIVLYDGTTVGDTVAYRITPENTSEIWTPEYAWNWGTEADTGNASALGEFIHKAKQEFPANEYGVILWNHGEGWRSLDTPEQSSLMKGICFDDTSLSYLNTQEIDGALSGVVNSTVPPEPFGVLAFDACLMQMMEVAYELQSSARFMVGSEALVPGNGLPYDTIFSTFVADNEVTPVICRDFANLIVNEYDARYSSETVYNGRTMSAIGLQPTPLDNGVYAVGEAINQFVWAVIPEFSGNIAPVQTAYANTTYFSNGYIDLADFAAQILAVSEVSATQNAAAALINLLTVGVNGKEPVILNHQHGITYPNSTGLSIYLPTTEMTSTEEIIYYTGLSFAQYTHWSEFITWFTGINPFFKPWKTLIYDDTEDPEPVPGISMMEYYLITDTIGFTVFYTSGAQEIWGNTYMDTDRDPLTGFPINDIGADYVVEFTNGETPSFTLKQYIDSAWENPVTLTTGVGIDTDGFAFWFDIPLASMGDDDGYMDVVQILGETGYAYSDIAPNSDATPAHGTTAPRNTTESIEDGLAWLVEQQNEDGSWGSVYYLGETALAVYKLEMYAWNDLGKDPLSETDDYAYRENVIAGLNYILSHGSPVYIVNPQAHQPVGYTDNAPAGDGIYFDETAPEGAHHAYQTYYTSISAMAIAASKHPELIYANEDSPLNLKSYGYILANTVDYLAWGQSDYGWARGGWNYSYSNNDAWIRSDQSNTGWVTLALAYAEAEPFYIPTPGWVRNELNIWVGNIQAPAPAGDASGGAYYTLEDLMGVNALRTGNLLQQFAFLGDTLASPRVQLSLDYLSRVWANPEQGWDNPSPSSFYHATYTIMKGLEALGITDLPGAIDWFTDFETTLVDEQLIDGSWPVSQFDTGDRVLSTVWALLTLEKEIPETAQGPDLTIIDKHEEWINPENQVEDYKIVFTIKNIGNVAVTAPFVVQVAVDQETPFETIIEASEQTPFNPGAEITIDTSQLITPYTPILSEDDDGIFIFVDVTLVIQELNEHNNTRSNHNPPLVNLTVTGKSEFWRDIEGSSYGVNFEITNTGNTLIPQGHKVALFIDEAQTANATLTIMEPLQPGETAFGTFGNSMTPIMFTGPSDTVRIVADFENIVQETDEDDNEMTNTWAPTNNVWAGFGTSYSYKVTGDSFTSQQVTGWKGWGMDTKSQDGFTSLTANLETELSFDWMNPLPDTDTTYTWSLGDVQGANVGIGLNAQDVEFTPGFNVSRSVDQQTFTEDGNQTVTITVTPLEAMNGLGINMGLNEDPLMIPTITNVVLSPNPEGTNIWISPDGKYFDVHIPDPTVSETYTCTVTIHIDLKLGVSSIDFVPMVNINELNNIDSGRLTGSQINRTVSGLGDWTVTADGDYVWDWAEFLNRNITLEGTNNNGGNNAWAGFGTSYSYKVTGDSFTSQQVTGWKGWGMDTKSQDGFTSLTANLETELSFDWMNPLPDTDTTYTWSLGDVQGANVGIGLNAQDVEFTPGFNVSRSVDQQTFTEDGDQTVTITVTPLEAMNGLGFNMGLNEGPLMIPTITNVVLSPNPEGTNIWISPDGKYFNVHIPDPTVSETYTCTVTIHIDLKLGVSSIDFVPMVNISELNNIDSGRLTGSQVNRTVSGLGDWTVTADGEYVWDWAEFLNRDITLEGTNNGGGNNAWLGISTDYGYKVAGDTFISDEVTGWKGWSMNTKSEGGFTSLAAGLNSQLSFQWMNPTPDLTPNPDDYVWLFGDVPGASVNVGSGAYAINYTPGFNVTREISPRTLTADSDQTLTITVTPLEAMERLGIDVNAQEDSSVIPTITAALVDPNSGVGIWITDVRTLRINIPNPTIGQTYTCTVTIHVELKPGVSSAEHMPWVNIFESINTASGMLTGSQVNRTVAELGVWTVTAVGEYVWNWGEYLNKSVTLEGTKNDDGVDAWLGVGTDYNHKITSDSFISHEVTGTKGWSMGMKSQDGFTSLAADLDSQLSFEWMNPSPDTDTNYTWSFGDVPGANINVGSSAFPIVYTPGFNVTREISPRILTADGDQTLTINLTPLEAMNGFGINMGVSENNLLIPTITNALVSPDPGAGIWISPDGKNLSINIPNPIVDQIYTCTVTIHVDLKPGVGSVEHMPWVGINESINIGNGILTGNEVIRPVADLGTWTVTTAGDYVWNWNEFLNKSVVLEGMSISPDLVVSEKHEEWVNPQNQAEGYRVYFTIQNIGTATVHSGIGVDLVGIDINMTRNDEPIAVEKQVTLPGALNPGETWVGSFDVTFPEPTGGQNDQIIVTVDVNQECPESNEINNIRGNLWPLYTMAYIGMNVNTAPFTNVKVRQAVYLALDRDTIDNIIAGSVKVQSIVTPQTANPNVNLGYNPVTARSLLLESGYEFGFKTDLYIPSTFSLDVAAAVRAYLLAIGIDATITPLEPAVFMSRYYARNMGLFLTGIGVWWAHPEGILGKLLISTSPGNATQYNNGTFDTQYNGGLYPDAENTAFSTTGGLPIVPLYWSANPPNVKPDLTISEAHEEWINSANHAEGYKVYFTVKNIGTGVTQSGIDIGMTKNGEPIAVEDQVLLPVVLNSGDTWSGSFDIIFPEPTGGQNDAIIVTADVNQECIESNETNNARPSLWPWYTMTYIGMNTVGETNPFADVRVRQAVYLTLDRDAIDNIIPGSVKVESIVTPLTANPNVNRGYNPGTADTLLMTAGYPDGFLTNLYIPSTFSIDVANAVKEDLAVIGINVQIQVLDLGMFMNRLTVTHDMNFYMMDLGVWWAHPEKILGLLLQSTSPFNATHYNNSTFDTQFNGGLFTDAENTAFSTTSGLPIVPLYWSATPPGAEEPPAAWTVHMTADASTNGLNDLLVFGTNTTATSSFDFGLDWEHLPLPPGSAFDAYFQTGNEEHPALDEDYRPLADSIQWTLYTYSTTRPITLTWDASGIPSELSAYMNTGLGLINMKAQNSVELAAGLYTIHIIVSSEVSVEIQLKAGWNMVSLPVTPADNSVSTLFPTVGGRAYRWNPVTKSYSWGTTMETGKGYFVTCPADTTVIITGVPLIEFTADISTGWNIIGSVASNTNFTAPNDNPDGSVGARAYRWNPVTKSYSWSTLIEPGKGYFVTASQNCILVLTITP